MAEQLAEVALTVSLNDRTEAGLQAVKRNAEQAGQATEQAFTKSGRALQTAANGLQFYIDAQGRARDAGGRFVTQLELQAAGLNGLSAAANRAGSGLQGFQAAFGKLAGQLAILETVRRAVFFTTDQITQLDKAQAALRTLGVNSDDLGKKLKTLSVELGNNISALELTKAAYDVASSGFADAASATEILRASSLGAQGGFAQLDDVVKAVTGVINAYGLSASDATGIVDKFLQTQNDGVITVRQYAAEIGNIASIAAAGGVGLDQLNAAIATATLRGVPVAQTFTGLRQALSSIIKPSQQAAELAASLGLQFNVSALRSKGLAGVLTDVQQKTGGAADKIAILLGSVEAQAAVQPLLNDRLAKYNELLGKQAQSSGAAAAAAETNSRTISGGIQQISNGFSNLATTLDKTLGPVFAGFLTSINQILVKLNQVSVLAPDRVRRREQQAVDVVQDAIGPFGGSVFSGVTVRFQGKTYKGSAAGVREAILQDLLKKELAAVTAPTSPAARAARPSAATAQASQPTEPVVNPDDLRLRQQSAAIQLRGLQERLAVTQQLQQLDEVGRRQLENRLAVNEQIRKVEQSQLELRRERERPIGTGTGAPGERNNKRIQELEGEIERGRLEIANSRLLNQQSESAALRTQQERLRGQQLESVNAAEKLRFTREQTQLELRALATGQEVSRTDQLRLQLQQQIGDRLRQQEAARKALAEEQGKPRDQQDAVAINGLFDRLRSANRDVRQAYADAGLSLVQNARSAADALKSAQRGFDGALRGNFELLPNNLRQQAIANARNSVQRGVDAGLIRTGVDISTPEALFRVASVSEQLQDSQKTLRDAVAENVKATTALTLKDWNVYVNTTGGSSQGPEFPTVGPSRQGGQSGSVPFLSNNYVFRGYDRQGVAVYVPRDLAGTGLR